MHGITSPILRTSARATHNGLWRIDVNLDGPENNSVYLVEHIEPDGMEKAKARSDVTPFNGGKEGFDTGRRAMAFSNESHSRSAPNACLASVFENGFRLSADNLCRANRLRSCGRPSLMLWRMASAIESPVCSEVSRTSARSSLVIARG